MRKLLRKLLLGTVVWLGWTSLALAAAATPVAPCVSVTSTSSGVTQEFCVPVTAANPLPVTSSGGSSSTANQGTPAVVANGWPMYLETGGAVNGLTNPIFVSPATGATFAVTGTVSISANQSVNVAQWGGAATGAATAVGTEASGNVPTFNAHITNAAGAAVQGFTPGGTYATLASTAVTGNVALPAGASVAVANVGQNLAYVNFGTSGAVTATSSNIPIAAGQTIAFTVGTNTFIAGISPAGATTLTLAGGTGAYSGTGGSVSLSAPANDVKAGPTTLAAPGDVPVNSQGSGSVGIQITGTNTGVTAAPQGTVDGTTWTTIGCYTEDTTGSPTSSFTGDGLWRCPISGLVSVRVHLTAISTGSAIITANASAGSSTQPAGTQGAAANIVGINAVAPAVGNGVTNTGTQRVTISSDSTGQIAIAASATGGATPLGNIGANNTTAVVVKASAGTIYGAQLYNIGSVPIYLKIYNATSATCGSGTPAARWMIPTASTAANGAGSNVPSGGIAFSTGITYCLTGGITDADTTAPAANTALVNLDWK